MKVYLEDGEAPRQKKESQSTTRLSSRSGGFKPSKPGRETYDGQGFGGAGRRSAKSKKRLDDESRGTDIGVADDSEYEATALESASEDVAAEEQQEQVTPEGEMGEEAAGESSELESEGEEEYPEEEFVAPSRRSLSLPRKRLSDDEMTEEEFEAYQASKRRKAQKKEKPVKGGKKSKNQPLTLGKNAGTAGKKASPEKKGLKTKPPKGTSISVGPSMKKPKPKPIQQEVDDFDAVFDGEPRKESIVSQLITVVEVGIGAALAFFGGSQLGYILISKIMTGG